MRLDAAAGTEDPIAVETLGPPVETTKATEEPAATCAPAAGLSLMTRPAATVALLCVVTVPSVRPALAIAAVAAA
jgi:hypothetical protein